MFSTSVTKRHCSYKNCDSMQGGEKTCSVTFFQFPRDEQRYNLWMQLGRCEITDKKGVKYLCSKHFDERKYVASNPRRKLLLATAIPYKYTSDDEDLSEEKDEQLENVGSTGEEYYSLHELNVEPEEIRNHETVGEQNDSNRFVESTINDDEECDMNIEEPDDDKLEESFTVKTGTYSSKKRKLKTDEWVPAEKIKYITYKSPTSSGKVTKPTTSQKLYSDNTMEKDQNDDSDNDDEENFSGHPYITTFIFRGEEYIQMPKNAYVKANRKLVKELEYYKNIVKTFKKQFENIKMLD